jgi:transposase
LVRQRTMLVNALRAHLAEFGTVAAQGLRNVGELTAIIRDKGDTRLPAVGRQVLQVLSNQIEHIEAAVAVLERQLLTWHKTNPVSQRLASIPGIGPTIATAIATTVADPKMFRSGRKFAAWLGLVPRQNSMGGKTRLGGITKRGNRYPRRLLIIIDPSVPEPGPTLPPGHPSLLIRRKCNTGRRRPMPIPSSTQVRGV